MLHSVIRPWLRNGFNPTCTCRTTNLHYNHYGSFDQPPANHVSWAQEILASNSNMSWRGCKYHYSTPRLVERPGAGKLKRLLQQPKFHAPKAFDGKEGIRQPRHVICSMEKCKRGDRYHCWLNHKLTMVPSLDYRFVSAVSCNGLRHSSRVATNFYKAALVETYAWRKIK